METKPGIKTSEFWLAMLLEYISADTISSSDRWEVQLAAVIMGGLAVIGYIWSRTKAKASDASE